MRCFVAFFAVSIAAAALAGCSNGGNYTGLSQPVNVVKRHTSSNYQLVYSFGTTNEDGRLPLGGLLNNHGVLYGTTYAGGSPSCGCGIVFSLTPSGTETVLHRFGSTDGAFPEGSLAVMNGVLYGTTSSGGTTSGGGNCSAYYQHTCGVAFSIAARGQGQYAVLHNFLGSPSDGAVPAGGLIALNGTLYGTTSAGGSAYESDAGIVYSLTPSGNETILHDFCAGTYGCVDGADSTAPLHAKNGVLYGTTFRGGYYYPGGAAFSITLSGKLTVLHLFGGNGYGDGANPQAGVVVTNGMVYGTTYSGGGHNAGTVFAIDQKGTEVILHSFGGRHDGSNPYGGLVMLNHTLYGTTQNGGENSGGTLFSITVHGDETVLHNFAYPGGTGDGSQPVALTKLNGTLYGVTTFGGTAGTTYGTGQGAVFSYTP